MSVLSESIKRLFRKPFTIKYPKQKPRLPPRFRGRLAWDKNKCIFCLQCQAACPVGVIKIDKERKTYEADLTKCLFCGRCQEVCPVPEKAVRLSQDFEMAKTRKEEIPERFS
ncbi:MAG: 4Fe-4S binding protein [Candidatus Aenigmatarchaeota archaeon]